MQLVCCQDRRANCLRHLNGAGQFGIGKQHTKLLAAVAPSDVSWPTDVLKNALSDRSERAISRNVPVVVIEILEVINVQHQDREALLVPSRAPPLDIKCGVQCTSAAKAREPIGVGKSLESLFYLEPQAKLLRERNVHQDTEYIEHP